MFDDALIAAQAAIQAAFDLRFAGYPDLPVVQGMVYATQGGKRLRGFLAMESARLHGVGADRAIWQALAIESIHAYSLVHDDLPCMDDDALRRGQPAVHVRWDVGTALLVGDGLQALAFELAAHPDAGPPEVRADLAHSLAQAAGARGMVLGQALDIAAQTAETPLSLAEITALQHGKTGALIGWAAESGARLAQADIAAMRSYALALGLAFQIADDLLDVSGDAAALGKAVGKDAAAGKATFVSLLGVDGARRRAAELVDRACEALSVYGDGAENLKQAARFAISRRN